MKQFQYQSKNNHVTFKLDIESPRETWQLYKNDFNKLKNKLHEKIKSRKENKPQKRQPFIDIEIVNKDGKVKRFKL